MTEIHYNDALIKLYDNLKNVMLAFRFAKNDFNWNPIDKMAAFLPWMDKKVKTGFWVF